MDIVHESVLPGKNILIEAWNVLSCSTRTPMKQTAHRAGGFPCSFAVSSAKGKKAGKGFDSVKISINLIEKANPQFVLTIPLSTTESKRRHTGAQNIFAESQTAVCQIVVCCLRHSPPTHGKAGVQSCSGSLM